MPNSKMFWTGWIVSLLAVFPFLLSATMKFLRLPAVVEGFGHLGLPESLILPLGILELLCVAVYLVPRTAVLGAILLTGFLGGAILTHLRVGEAVYIHCLIGILAWLGLWLREPRLRALLPVRTPSS